MEFRMLGSLEAAAGGQPISLGRPSERTLLAVLLLDAGHVVSVSRLVDALWPDKPPTTAVKQVRNAAGRLRQALAAGGTAEAVVTDHGGYRINVADHCLDSHRFEAAVIGAGRVAATGQRPAACRLLEAALGLWRGPFLAGMRGQEIDVAAAAWEERRNAATDSYHEHMLALGQHQQIVAGLSRLATDQPLCESTTAHLMLALYRCGRQADALAIYRKTRAALAAELGLDPGPALQLLHQQILTSDPALAAPVPRLRHRMPVHLGRAGQRTGTPRPSRRRQQVTAAVHDPHSSLAQATSSTSLLVAQVRASGADPMPWQHQAEQARAAPGFPAWQAGAYPDPPWPEQPVTDGADPEQAGCGPDATTVHARRIALTGARVILGELELRYSPRQNAAWGRFHGYSSLDHIAGQRHVEVEIQTCRDDGGTTSPTRIDYLYDYHWSDLLRTGTGSAVYARARLYFDGDQAATQDTDHIALT
jgi:DNA-binding SARP family transcriptional activator